MEREIGIGVIWMGWMGRVHRVVLFAGCSTTSRTRVRPRLVVAADLSPAPPGARRAGRLRAHDRRLARGVDDPAVEAVNVTLPNVDAPRGGGRRAARRASTCGSRSRWAAGSRTPRRWPRPCGGRASSAGVGFCYRFAPAVQHARAADRRGRDRRDQPLPRRLPGRLRQPPDAAAVVAVLARRRRLGRARRPDGARGRPDALPGRPDRRLSGRTATNIPRARASPGEGTHFSRVESDDLVDVENEDWAGALIEFGGGTVGSLEASRVVVGPRDELRRRDPRHARRARLGAWSA